MLAMADEEPKKKKNGAGEEGTGNDEDPQEEGLEPVDELEGERDVL